MLRVSDLFDVEYGHNLSLNKLHQTNPGHGIAFVSRTAKNNGVSAWVEPVKGVTPLPAGLLTVCLRSRNSALSTFVQPRPFYCGYHIYVLWPKHEMSLQEKAWWAQCIEANRYRYNFGRQANRTLASLELPDAVPDWARSVPIPTFESKNATRDIPLDTESWREFRIGDLFDLRRGRNVVKREMSAGSTAYVSASSVDNGISAWINLAPDYPGGQITINSNGSVGEAFYQPYPFIASGDVTVLIPEVPLSPAAALFFCTLVHADKYRWNYGRKWVLTKIRESIVRLPVTSTGNPDWEFAERYMQSLPLAAAALQGHRPEDLS